MAGLFFVSEASAELDEWADWMERGKAQEMEGEYTPAASCYQKAMRIAEKASAYDHLAIALNGLGLAHAHLGRSAESEREFSRALSVLDSAGLKHTAGYTNVLANLGGLLRTEGRTVQAEARLREVLSLSQTLQPPDEDKVAVASTILAKVLVDRRSFLEAETLLASALGTFEAKSPKTPESLVITLNAYGELRRAQRRFKEAAAYFERALALITENGDFKHPWVVRLLNNVATSYVELGRSAEAEPLLQRAIAIMEHHPRSEPNVYSAVLMNYSVLLRRNGQKAEARKLEERANAIHAAMPVDIAVLKR